MARSLERRDPPLISNSSSFALLSSAGIALTLAACGDDTPPVEDAPILQRASESSTVDVSPDDSLVAMVNPMEGSVSVFQTSDDSRLSQVTTGAEPSAVVFHPNGTTLFVANRADATVVPVTGADTATPSVGTAVNVGSEPTGLALSPTGAMLFVANFAEGSVSVIDTTTMTITSTLEGPEHPFALAVTNDGDQEDTDESVIIPEFFGEPIGDEATDTSRQGRVRIYSLATLLPTDAIVFPPVESGFNSTMTSPNQFHSVAINAGRIYVTSISASPDGPTEVNENVQPVVYVGDFRTRTPVSTGDGTVNLAQKLRDDSSTDPFQFMADTVGISFVGGDSGIGYAVSRGADAVQRVVFGASDVTVGSTNNLQIDVLPAPSGSTAGCQGPTGIKTAHTANRAFLNCWVNRQLGILDLASQTLEKTVESSTSSESAEVSLGRRFFFTGRARWSQDGWSSCGSCHPGGLTDNITWSFAAGPRQSTSLDGSFSHPATGEQQQRIFNWTAIRDEMHDFERNTRNVSKGLGAVVMAGEGADCSDVAAQVRINIDPSGDSPPLDGPRPDFLLKPVKEFQDDAVISCVRDDWDAIEAWSKTIRPPRALQSVDVAAAARGATLFGTGCAGCHGGPGWTVSRRFYEPTEATNAALHSEPFTVPGAPFNASWNSHSTNQFAVQPDPDGDGPLGVAAPVQVACVIRNVGTFGSDTLEVRQNEARAQGQLGYNVPSLYGLSLGAPYLHHGQAASLEALLTSTEFMNHTQAIDSNFLAGATADQDRADLIAFLLSIDASTPIQDIPTGFDACPQTFTAPQP